MTIFNRAVKKSIQLIYTSHWEEILGTSHNFYTVVAFPKGKGSHDGCGKHLLLCVALGYWPQ